MDFPAQPGASQRGREGRALEGAWFVSSNSFDKGMGPEAILAQFASKVCQATRDVMINLGPYPYRIGHVF
jgi:hypothetical protein